MWGVWKSKKQPSHYMLMDHTNFNAQLKLGTTLSQHGPKWVEMGQNGNCILPPHVTQHCRISQQLNDRQCLSYSALMGNMRSVKCQTTGDFISIQKNKSHRIRMTLMLWYSECHTRQMCWLAILEIAMQMTTKSAISSKQCTKPHLSSNGWPRIPSSEQEMKTMK